MFRDNLTNRIISENQQDLKELGLNIWNQTNIIDGFNTKYINDNMSSEIETIVQMEIKNN